MVLDGNLWYHMVIDGIRKYCMVLNEIRFHSVPGSVQVPKNWTRGQKSFRTGPGTAIISESVLEPEPELPKALGQFQYLNFWNVSSHLKKCKYSFWMCVRKKLVINRSKKKTKHRNITV